MGSTANTTNGKWLTVGDHYPREDYESIAYQVANKRDAPWQRTAVFQTPHGLLILDWGRYGWDARWLENAVPLDLGRIGG